MAAPLDCQHDPSLGTALVKQSIAYMWHQDLAEIRDFEIWAAEFIEVFL
jgi:hypothetical protein